MTSLPRCYDVTNSATMTSLILLLWHQYHHYYDVTNLAAMTSLPPLLWRHYHRYFDVTDPATMTLLTPLLASLLWRHYQHNYDVTISTTMTSRNHLLYHDVTKPALPSGLSITTILPPFFYNKTIHKYLYFSIFIPCINIIRNANI